MRVALVRNLVLLMAIMSCAYGIASEGVVKKSVSENDLALFFDSVIYTGTNVVFRFKKAGPRFVYWVNGQPEGQVSEYGKIISLDCSSELKISDRHLTLIIAPCDRRVTNRGFKLSFRKDFRSMGKGLSSEYARLVVDENSKSLSSNGVKNVARCLSGLKICPLDAEN